MHIGCLGQGSEIPQRERESSSVWDCGFQVGGHGGRFQQLVSELT